MITSLRKGIVPEMIMIIIKGILSLMFIGAVVALIFNTVVTSHVSADKNSFDVLIKDINNLCAQVKQTTDRETTTGNIRWPNYWFSSSLQTVSFVDSLEEILPEGDYPEDFKGPGIYITWKRGIEAVYLLGACGGWLEIQLDNKHTDGTLTTDQASEKKEPLLLTQTDYVVTPFVEVISKDGVFTKKVFLNFEDDTRE